MKVDMKNSLSPLRGRLDTLMRPRHATFYTFHFKYLQLKLDNDWTSITIVFTCLKLLTVTKWRQFLSPQTVSEELATLR